MTRINIGVLSLVGVALGVVPQAQQHQHPAGEKLGTVHFQTSCSSAAAGGVRPRAGLAAFVRVRPGHRADSPPPPRPIRRCAMAHWGIAIAAGPTRSPPTIRPPAQIQQGLDAIAQAEQIGAEDAIGSARTSRRRSKLYTRCAARSTSARASSRTRRRWPTSRRRTRTTARRPSSGRCRSPRRRCRLTRPTRTSSRPARFSRSSIPSQPDHPGITHYIIHSYDVPALAERAQSAAHRYAKIAPSAPHALHMPSHTFTRVGAWQDSIDTNIASAEAAGKGDARAEELHAMDYMAYAYLQTGQDRAAQAVMPAHSRHRRRVRSQRRGWARRPDRPVSSRSPRFRRGGRSSTATGRRPPR